MECWAQLACAPRLAGSHPHDDGTVRLGSIIVNSLWGVVVRGGLGCESWSSRTGGIMWEGL